MKNNKIIALLACVCLAQSFGISPAWSKLKHEQTPHLTAQEQDESSAKEAADTQQDDAKESKPAKAGDKNKNKTQAASADSDKSKDKDKDKEPKPSVVEHSVIIDGKLVRYKSIAGYMVLKDYDNKAKKNASDDKDQANAQKDKSDNKSKDKDKEPKSLAKIFYIAYVREDTGTAKRPVTFSFNGGPGSASIWLHMGALGPRRAVLTDRGEALPPPYRLEDNNYSWLDQTDLVFIDPVSTGFSRVEPDEDPKKYHGYDEDINSVGEFIRLYLTKYNRWTSPKFVIGESYGTTRAAGLSDFLQNRYGIYLNGIILVSAVLNFQTLDFSPGNELPFELFMPSYTAAAWYHKKLAPDLLSKRLTDVLSEAEDFAAHDYRTALFEGDKLSPDKKQEIADHLSRLIGLSPGYISQLGDEVPFDLFATHLLMEQNRQIGRYDSRYTGMRYNPGRDDMEFDPSFEAVNGPFTATFNDYARRELHFESELPYETLANVWPWKYQRAQNRYLNVAEDLRKAMIRNPYLKVWLCCGYYDLATPYFASKYTVDQMSLEPPIRKNIRLTYYNSGHMLYVLKPALVQFKSDFQNFLRDALLPDSSVVPTAEP